MKYQILQAKSSRTFLKFTLCFDLDKAKEAGFDLKYYKVVYEGNIEPENKNEDLKVEHYLEHLFYVFNCDHPADFEGHSLSVGDVVKLNDEYYYVATYGFNKIK